MTRDPQPAIRLIAEASQLLAEIREALPILAPEVQLEARALDQPARADGDTLSFALTATPLPPAGQDRPGPDVGPPQG